jgi:hypothetical protein
MLLALALAGLSAFSLADCVPARWAPTDPGSLKLLDDTKVNCLVVEEPAWKPAFLEAARQRGVKVLASLPATDTEAAAKRAIAAGVDGLYVEGLSDTKTLAALDAMGKPVAWLPARVHMPVSSKEASAKRSVVGTYQGLWAGVKLGHEGEAAAAPSGPPWIDTNSGFLRFLRTITPADAAVWLANRPPADQYIVHTRYLQAVGDASMAGARWVLSFDDSFWQSLLKGEDVSVVTWKRVNALVAFYEQHREFTQYPDYSQLAIVQDIDSGALVSGSVLDMVESKHIPAFVVPPAALDSTQEKPVKLMLNIDPQSLTDEQRQQVRNAARRGAMVMNGPPQWKLSLPPAEMITFTDEQLAQLDEIWKEINRVIGRENFAVRLFGAPSMLSNLKAAKDGSAVALHLVNYSDYPVEGITVHTLQRFRSATLLTPQGEESPELYEHEDGSGIDIDKVEDSAILVLRP